MASCTQIVLLLMTFGLFAGATDRLHAQSDQLAALYLPVESIESVGDRVVVTVEGWLSGSADTVLLVDAATGGEVYPMVVTRLLHGDSRTARLALRPVPEGLFPERTDGVWLLAVDRAIDTTGMSVLRRAAVTGIYLTAGSGRLTSGAEARSGPVSETKVVDELLASLNAAGEHLNRDPSTDPELTAPIAYGSLSGLSLADALEQADSASLIRAIEYLLSDPVRFRSPSLPILEAYAWWAAFGGPVSPDHLLGRLLAAESPATREELIETYREEILVHEFVDRWSTEAERIGSAGDLDGARAVATIAIEAAAYLGRPIDLAWGYFVQARILDMSDSLERSATVYGRSIELFEQADDSLGLSYALNNAGSVARRLGELDRSIRLLDRAIAIKRELPGSDLQPSALIALAQSYVGRGSTWSEAGDPAAAAADYADGANHYERAGDLSNGAYYYHQSALQKQRLGDHGGMREALQRAVSLYERLGMTESVADMVDEIAYSWSLQGDHRRALEQYERAYRLHREAGELDDAGFSKGNVGQSYWSLGDFRSAEQAHREAILLRQDAGNRVGEAYSWKKLAIMFLDNGEPVKARDAVERAEELTRLVGSPIDRAELAKVRGDLLAAYGTSGSAVAAYEEGVRGYIAAGAVALAAEALADLGDLLLGDRNLTAAERAYDRSRRLMLESGDTTGSYRATAGLGLVAWNQWNFDAASDWLSRAVGLAERSGTREEIAWTLLSAGQVDLARGRSRQARQAYFRARDLYDSTAHFDGQIDARLNLGYLLTEAGDFAAAMAEFASAEAIAESSGRRGRIADVLSARAGLHLLLAEFDEALASDSLSLMLAREAENAWGMAGAYIGLGNTWNTIGEFQRAYDSYARADSIYLAIGDTLGRGTPLNNMGTIWFFQGDYERALEHFSGTLEILRAHNIYSEFLAIAVTNIGEVYHEQGRNHDADEWLHAGIDVADSVGARRILASGMTIRTKVLRDLGRLDEAFELGSEAERIARQIGEVEQRAEIHGVLGEIHVLQKRREEAEQEFSEAIALARRIGSYRYLWRPLSRLARLRQEAGRAEEAASLFAEAIDAIEHMRRRMVGGEEARKVFDADGERIGVYESLVALLIERGEVERALGYLERSSNEELRARFSPGTIDPEAEGSRRIETGRRMKAKVDLLAEQIIRAESEDRESSRKVAGLREVYSVAESEYIGFVSETIENEPGLRNYFSTGVNPVDLRSRKRKIPEDIAVLSYLPGETSLFTFVATRDTVVARVVPVGRRELAGVVAQLYATASRAPADPLRIDADARIRESSERLWGWLLDPVVDLLSEKKRLAVIQSGDLGYLPIGLLAGADGVAVRQRWSTFQIVDLGLFLQGEGEERQERIAAFANADGSLLHSQREAEAVVSMYPGSLLLSGAEATESRAKNIPSGYSILHFATHGVLDYTDVEKSWLALAADPSAGEDGRLTLSEIWGITNLADCRMVILSACNSAIGDTLVEGWPINPANAFLQVGVPTVLATLWKVDDEATARLIVEFYRSLRQRGAADALQHAQNVLAADPRYADPYYWAPFILLGDWR